MGEKAESSKQSLALLTEGLINLLKEQKDTEIEINKASEILDASKRRLYDVTNVLQGIGLIERSGKSKIKWVEPNQKSNNKFSYQDAENELLQISAFLDSQIEELTNSDMFQSLGWITDNDIQFTKKDKNTKIFALKGPASLAVQVDETEDGSYRMICQSEDLPISWIPIGRN